MKTLKIHTVGVEFPTNTTSVTVDIIESLGSITRVVETLTVEIPGIYQHMTTELYNAVALEIINAGFDIPNPVPEDVNGGESSPDVENTGT